MKIIELEDGKQIVADNIASITKYQNGSCELVTIDNTTYPITEVQYNDILYYFND